MYRIGQAAKPLGVTPKTLRVWERQDKIHPIRTPGNQRRYPQEEVDRLLGIVRPERPRCVIYARVSSHKQAADGNLERQRKRLEAYAVDKGYEVVKVLVEIASGLNEKRRKLSRLLRMARDRQIDVVVIEFKDRLARFGFHYIEQYLAAFNVTIDIVNGKEPKSAQEELVADMLAILSSFSAKLYGQRSKKFRRKVKEAMAECSIPSGERS
jgi:predicted site-specific integrase-resolvase